MTRLVGIGEPLAVFTAAGTGPVRTGDPFRVGLGGAECNVAVACRRLGVPTAVIGAVGDDPLGAALLRALRADDVDISGVAVEAGASTGVMVKEMRAAGQVRISYARTASAGSRVAARHLSAGGLDGASVVHSTGITASFGEHAQGLLYDAARLVRDQGGLFSLDVNYRSRLWPDVDTARDALQALVSQADVVFLGLAEADVLLGMAAAEPAEIVAAVAAMGPAQVVLKAGATAHALVDGAPTALTGGGAVVLDPVGAGDAFAAGYLVGLLRGDPVEVRLRTAHLLGRWAVTTHGDHDGLPYDGELLAFDGDDVLR